MICSDSGPLDSLSLSIHCAHSEAWVHVDTFKNYGRVFRLEPTRVDHSLRLRNPHAGLIAAKQEHGWAGVVEHRVWRGSWFV
jgi:hypothetical protein